MGQENKLTLEEIGLVVARIEGKLDVLNVRSAALETSHTDHELRLRSLEQKSVVTTKQLWSALVGVATTVGVVSQVIYYASSGK